MNDNPSEEELEAYRQATIWAGMGVISSLMGLTSSILAIVSAFGNHPNKSFILLVLAWIAIFLSHMFVRQSKKEVKKYEKL